MKKLLIVALLTSVLLACSGGGSPTTSSPAAGGTPAVSTPATSAKIIIENEDLTPGLKGVDADNNGIRDDIDRLIVKKYSTTPALKKATEQKARALQVFMEATTREKALAASDANGRAWACVRKRLPSADPTNTEIMHVMSREIEALTANTKERFTKYWNSNKLIGGGYFSQPVEPVCD